MTHPVIERLRSADAAERRAACLAAVDDPAATLLIDALTEALGDSDRAVARAASEGLASLARRDDEVVRAVRAALRGDDGPRRFMAALTCSRIEPPSARILPPAVEALGHPDGTVRWEAARLLVEAGRVLGEVLPLMLGLMETSESPAVRRMAVYCAAELAPERVESSRALAAAAGDSSPHVRHAALTAAGAVREPTTELYRRLSEAAEDATDPTARRIAAISLGRLAENQGAEFPAQLRGLIAARPDSEPGPFSKPRPNSEQQEVD